MIEYTPDKITAATIEQMSTTTDPRLKTIMESAVRHLHAFAREVNITPAEWVFGIQFLTRVGHMCSASRQEIILLSDTLGLSTLVNTLHDTTALEDATHTSLLGPFFRENTPVMERGAQIGSDVSTGEIVLWGRVTNVDGAPIANAMVTVWQTAADGLKIINYSETSGPYSVDSDDGNGNIVLKQNPHHYFSTNEVAKKIVIVPTDLKSGNSSITAFKEGRVDHITTIDATKPEDIINFAQSNLESELHVTMKIRTLVLVFTQKGEQEFSETERRYIGKQKKVAFNKIIMVSQELNKDQNFFQI